MEVLAPDVVLVADGGGIVQAVRRPIAGAIGVARLLGHFPTRAGGAVLDPVWINGGAAALIVRGEEVTAVSVEVEGGRITRIYAMRNPAKLAGLARPTSLVRE